MLPILMDLIIERDCFYRISSPIFIHNAEEIKNYYICLPRYIVKLNSEAPSRYFDKSGQEREHSTFSS